MKNSTATIVAAIIGALALLSATFIGLYHKEDKKEVQKQLHTETSPNTIEEKGNEKIIKIIGSRAIEERIIENTFDCSGLASTQEVQKCFKKIISKGDRIEIDSEIKKALSTNSNTLLSIALKAYLAIQPELKLAFTAPEPEIERLKEYIDNPTRENEREMLRSRYLLFLNAANFQHVFSISKFDIDSGKGQLREIGKGRKTPHNFQVIGTEFGFNTPWCLDKKINCKCRYDLRLKDYKLEGDAVCTGYFGFKPLKVEHLLQLN